MAMRRVGSPVWLRLEGESCEYPWLGGIGPLQPPEVEAFREVHKLLPFKRLVFSPGYWIDILSVGVSPGLWFDILTPLLGPASEGILNQSGQRARLYQVNGSALWYWIGYGTYAFHVSQVQLRCREENERYKARHGIP